jgi:hypothetical protein
VQLSRHSADSFPSDTGVSPSDTADDFSSRPSELRAWNQDHVASAPTNRSTDTGVSTSDTADDFSSCISEFRAWDQDNVATSPADWDTDTRFPATY